MKNQTPPFFHRKYLLDRLVGTAMMLLVSPVLLALFALVKLTSSGPGFYKQKRVGLDGKVFEIVKLRSMRKDAERPGRPVWSGKGDVRVTTLGRFLRATHLDELPQLWNVMAGDMSLVGPRPERPEICRELAETIDGYFERVSVKPGVTGLSQINLPPDQTLDDVRRKQILDMRYIDEANFWLDIRIIAATAFRMLGMNISSIVRTLGVSRIRLTSHIGQPPIAINTNIANSETSPTFKLSTESSDSGVLL